MIQNDPQSLAVARSFDQISEDFDSTFENDITRSIRETVYERITALIPKGSMILDANCGTGIDAIELSRQGMRVTGIDISPGMIKRATAKQSGGPPIAFQTGTFEDLSFLPRNSFDLALSNFGGLNCIEDLAGVAREVTNVLRPGGFFLAMVMPPFSVWESASYVLRGNMKGAFRRSSRNVPATGFRQHTFNVYYHSINSVRNAFDRFSVVSAEGISIFSPTPQSSGFVRHFPTLTRALQRFDSVVNRLPVIRSCGDHFLIILQKRTD